MFIKKYSILNIQTATAEQNNIFTRKKNCACILLSKVYTTFENLEKNSKILSDQKSIFKSLQARIYGRCKCAGGVRRKNKSDRRKPRKY